MFTTMRAAAAVEVSRVSPPETSATSRFEQRSMSSPRSRTLRVSRSNVATAIRSMQNGANLLKQCGDSGPI